jgi:predicted phosphodiesterase
MDAHDALAKLRDLAIELGRSPKRDEFATYARVGKDYANRHFGTYAAMLQAAGLETYVRPRTIDNSIFEKSIAKHLDEYIPHEKKEPFKNPTMAVISDIHWPFSCQRIIDAFYEYVSRSKPEYVIINGDAMDMYSHAKFPRSHNQFTPREEQTAARMMNESFWKNVQSAHPTAKCFQMLGNHDIRPLKRVLEAYPEAEDWIGESIRKLFTFEGVETIHDTRQELLLGNIVIHHGHRSKLGEHRDYNLQNSISSHTHRPGVVYRTVRDEVIWELNTGYAGDPAAKGLSYTATRTVDWVQSFGVIDEYGPRVVIA